MSTIKFAMLRDINGFNSFGLTPTAENYNVTLSAGAAQDLCTVPETFINWAAVFYYQDGSNVFVAVDDDAELPGGTPAQSNSQGKPSVRLVQGGQTISAITSDTTTDVGVSLYAIS